MKGYEKIKTVYYPKDAIDEWVYENPTNESSRDASAVDSIQKINFYNKNEHKIGNILQNCTSYVSNDNELTIYRSTYFFKNGTITFDLNFKNQTSNRTVNTGKYTFDIINGTGHYLKIKGRVVFEALPDKQSTRKVTFYKKK